MGKIYAKLDSEGNIVSIKPHPGWLDDEGKLVNDKILLGFGYVPIVDDEVEEIDEWHQKVLNPKEEWKYINGKYKCLIYNEEKEQFEEVEREGIYLIKRTYKIIEISKKEAILKVKPLLTFRFLNKFYYLKRNLFFNSGISDIQMLESLKLLNNFPILVRDYSNSFYEFNEDELDNLILSLKRYRIFCKWLKWIFNEFFKILTESSVEDIKKFYTENKSLYDVLKRNVICSSRNFWVSDYFISYNYQEDSLEIFDSNKNLIRKVDKNTPNDLLIVLISVLSEVYNG